MIEDRAQIAKRHFIIISGVKILNVVSSFLLISLAIKFLGVEKYGLWVTISVFINWIYLFDLGIGNGMRNELSKKLALKDFGAAKTVVSTSYVALSIPILAVTLISIPIIGYVDWTSALNVSDAFESEIKVALHILLIFFGIRLILNLISSVLLADQKSGASESISLVASVSTLIAVFVSSQFAVLDLVNMSAYSMALPTVLLLFFSIALYRKTYLRIRPSLFSFSRRAFPSIFSSGLKFLFIQAGGLFFFSAGIFFLGSWGGQEYVAEFNVVYKYFSIILVFSSAYAIPMWSLSTNAEALGERDMYQRLTRNALKLLGAVIGIYVVMAVGGKLVFSIWVREIEPISYTEILLIGMLVVLQSVSHPFSSVINGSGKIWLSIISVALRALAFYPLCLLLHNYWNGVGIIVAMLIMQGIATLLQVLQVRELAKTNRTKTIWSM